MAARKTADRFVSLVQGEIGRPYVWGGDTPKGFDCSGLVYWALKTMGVRGVPRTSEEQYAWATPVAVNDLQAGDLVFMNFPGETSPGHVMVYAGGSKVVQAPSPGSDVQQIGFQPKPKGTSEWGGVIVGYGRVPGLTYSGPSHGDVTGEGKSIYQQPARPGSGQGGADYAGVFGIPDVPDVPGLPSHVPGLNDLPGYGAIHSLWDGLNGVSDVFSAIREGVKVVLWLIQPKHWAMMAEVVVGSVLIGLGIYWLGGGDTRLGDSGFEMSLPAIAKKLPFLAAVE